MHMPRKLFITGDCEYVFVMNDRTDLILVYLI